MAKKPPRFEPKRVARLSPEHFLNRELQTLEFNRRVLAQAEDKSTPLLELESAQRQGRMLIGPTSNPGTTNTGIVN